jgi:hypothetical protein
MKRREFDEELASDRWPGAARLRCGRAEVLSTGKAPDSGGR